MKKIIAIVLTLAMLACVPISASASEEDQFLTADSSATSIITYTHPSEYIVRIPYVMDFNTEYTLDAEVMNILPEEYVVVNISNLNSNNNLVFTHTHELIHNCTFEATPVQCDNGISFIGYEISESTVALFQIGVQPSFLSFHFEIATPYSEVAAGTYNATAEFTVSIYSH